MVGPHVPLLFPASTPVAVGWLIITVVVNAVDGKTRLVTISSGPVPKGNEVPPLVTDTDTSTPVVAIANRAWILATLSHICPNRIQLTVGRVRPTSAMLNVGSLHGIHIRLLTAFSVPIPPIIAASIFRKNDPARPHFFTDFW
jgi:hypothetical protein